VRSSLRAPIFSFLALMLLVTSCDGGNEGPGAPSGSGVQVDAGVEYASPGGQPLLMDVYTPPGDGPFPAVEAIHGGGFVGGDRSEMRGVSTYLATSGYVVFAIDYRLAPQATYPAQVEDARAAIVYVRDHAADLEVDPDRVAVLGTSAGGTIGATLAGSGAGTDGSRVGAVVSWSGAFDLPALATQGLAVGELRVERYVGVVDASTPDATALLSEASPIQHVTPDYPPTFVVNARQELMPFDQALAMADALQAAGVEHVLYAPATGHGLEYAREAAPRTVRFLDTYL
jgi:acetyl esterase/lipase